MHLLHKKIIQLVRKIVRNQSINDQRTPITEKCKSKWQVFNLDSKEKNAR